MSVAHPELIGVASVVTALGTWWFCAPAVLAAAALGRSAPTWPRRCAVAAVVCLGGWATRLLLSDALGRMRPPRALWRTAASGFSFPSGHATTAALAAMSCLLLLPRVRRRWPVYAVAALWPVAVGLSRLALRVHWLTDVLGGWSLAAVWACVGWLLLAVRTGARAGAGPVMGRRKMVTRTADTTERRESTS